MLPPLVASGSPCGYQPAHGTVRPADPTRPSYEATSTDAQ